MMSKDDLRRKQTTVLLTITLLLTTFPALAPRASSQGTLAEWTKGDFWDYSSQVTYGGEPGNTTYKVEVLGEQDLGSPGYSTYHCLIWINITSTHGEMRAGLHVYYLTGNLGLARMGKYPSANKYITYSPPVETFRFPLEYGSEWSAAPLIEQKQTSPPSSGSYIAHLNFTVSGPERVDVPAGSFDAYVIDTRKPTRIHISSFYYSNAVGNAVKIENVSIGFDSYFNYGIFPCQLELNAFTYQENEPASLGAVLIPIAIIAVIVVAVVIIVVYVLRRRDRAKPRQQAPSEQDQGNQTGERR
jgi:hypothetical protein